ncbi:MAG: hypothetical protein U5Q03_11245 [Bacteroidota bacterium]|nr:hypothetical protein [Bacteroidota bacterium]
MVLLQTGRAEQSQLMHSRKAGKENNQLALTNFYLGLSYLGKGETDKAIPLLKEISQSQGELKETAQWYLSLAYLKERANCKQPEDAG